MLSPVIAVEVWCVGSRVLQRASPAAETPQTAETATAPAQDGLSNKKDEEDDGENPTQSQEDCFHEGRKVLSHLQSFDEVSG